MSDRGKQLLDAMSDAERAAIINAVAEGYTPPNGPETVDLCGGGDWVRPRPMATALRLARKRAGLNQKAVAAAIGVSQAHVSSLETHRGNRTPSIGLAQRWFDACGYRLVVRVEPKEAE